MHLHAVVYPAGLQLLQPVCQLTVELGHGCRWRDGVRGVPAVREKDAEGRDDQDSDQAHHDYERKNDPAARREGGEQRLSGGNDGPWPLPRRIWLLLWQLQPLSGPWRGQPGRCAG